MKILVSTGLIVIDLKRFIMKSLLLLLLFMFSISCSDNSSVDGVQKYEIVCKHPVGHVARYPVSFNTFWSPHANAAGIFRFKTIDGRIVRSSFCHGEAIH